MNEQKTEFDQLTEEQQAEAKKVYLECREKLSCKMIFDYLASNPKRDPYVGHSYALMIANPGQEEQVVLNLLEALSESNFRMAQQIQTMMAMQEPSLMDPTKHNVRRGNGALPKGGVIEFPGGKT